jgi:hypothetical protein
VSLLDNKPCHVPLELADKSKGGSKRPKKRKIQAIPLMRTKILEPRSFTTRIHV